MLRERYDLMNLFDITTAIVDQARQVRAALQGQTTRSAIQWRAAPRSKPQVPGWVDTRQTASQCSRAHCKAVCRSVSNQRSLEFKVGNALHTGNIIDEAMRRHRKRS